MELFVPLLIGMTLIWLIGRGVPWNAKLLTLAVTPANVYMLQQAANYPAVPHWALVLRLPLQAVLLALVAWSSGVFRSRHTAAP